MAARSMMRRGGIGGATLFAGVVAGASLFGAAGCDEKAGADVEVVRINGEKFFLEIAADEQTRIKGLGGRDFIAPDGGMIFVFPQPQRMAFVMRDCPIPIDVAFLDASGRVVALHEMTPEAPKRPDESAAAYEQRLTQWESRFPAQFAVETAGGRLKEAGLSEGDVVKFDVERLKRLAQ
ncbi:MAG: DUF192 domain-containing protein [Planctomycetota bacterium]|nr:DUF192 domain-containing protein [Planctomycetota bacterium]